MYIPASILFVSTFMVVTGMLSDVQVDYKLFTPELGPNNPVVFKRDHYNDTIFDPTRTYKILCHGWNSHDLSTWFKRTIEEYFKVNLKFNIITTGYVKAVSSKIYVPAAYNVQEVGEKIGYALINLKQHKNISYENMHIIGHSLGAHVAGVAGETIFKNTGKKVGRITGLDPASILFTKSKNNDQISKGDAIFVDIIHTSSMLAFSVPIGNADFYPNGGKIQPGCIQNDHRCYHIAATIYFYESINNEKFLSKNCGSFTQYLNKKCKNGTSFMGEHADIQANGSYYLVTDPKLGKSFYNKNMTFPL